ncbi:MAG: hypothetical protein M0036_08200 [Desulfobacteraceae bacterium]|nr:hypothetical protein [Desulfobacteraceae bacterium]
MNQELQRIEPTKVKITHLQFQAWPATGLLPNRICFLHTYLKLRRQDAKKTADPVEPIEKWMTLAN